MLSHHYLTLKRKLYETICNKVSANRLRLLGRRKRPPHIIVSTSTLAIGCTSEREMYNNMLYIFYINNHKGLFFFIRKSLTKLKKEQTSIVFILKKLHFKKNDKKSSEKFQFLASLSLSLSIHLPTIYLPSTQTAKHVQTCTQTHNQSELIKIK